MQTAAARLLGRHDFAAFETTGAPRASTIRTVFAHTVSATEDWSPLQLPSLPGVDRELIRLEIEGDGFLYNMVRTIAGTLLKVGRGAWTADDVAAILASCDRTQAGETAPARGLALMQVRYEDDRMFGDVGSETLAAASHGVVAASRPSSTSPPSQRPDDVT